MNDSSEEIYEDSEDEKRICYACVRDTYLSSLIVKAKQDGACSYCAETGATTSIQELADKIRGAFQRHYRRTETEASGLDAVFAKEAGYWQRPGEPASIAIADAAGLGEEPAEDIRLILEEHNDEFDSGAIGDPVWLRDACEMTMLRRRECVDGAARLDPSQAGQQFRRSDAPDRSVTQPWEKVCFEAGNDFLRMRVRPIWLLLSKSLPGDRLERLRRSLSFRIAFRSRIDPISQKSPTLVAFLACAFQRNVRVGAE